MVIIQLLSGVVFVPDGREKIGSKPVLAVRQLQRADDPKRPPLVPMRCR